MEKQQIKNHPLYSEYTQMRIREKRLLCDQEELRGECTENEDFIKSCKTFDSARKKLDEIEKILRGEMTNSIKTGNLSN